MGNKARHVATPISLSNQVTSQTEFSDAAADCMLKTCSSEFLTRSALGELPNRPWFICKLNAGQLLAKKLAYRR